MKYITFDDIIYGIQKFGGATTYWREVTERVAGILGEEKICRISSRGGLFERLRSPSVNSRIFHSSHFRVASGGKAKNVTTIHDLIYEKEMIGGKGKVLNLYERQRSIVKADAIICISESTKADVLDYYGRLVQGKPIYVIHHGVNMPAPDLAGADICEKIFGSRGKRNYYLYVGGRGGYKNFRLAIEVFAKEGFYKNGIELLCTGADFSQGEIFELEKLGIRKYVTSLGQINLSELSVVYRNAIALIYPSVYEGFGLPPLEAMANCCPVIASNKSSLPEIVGSAGILVDPGNTDELSAAMNQMLISSTRDKYINLGWGWCKNFTWEKSARKHIEVYASL